MYFLSWLRIPAVETFLRILILLFRASLHPGVASLRPLPRESTGKKTTTGRALLAAFDKAAEIQVGTPARKSAPPNLERCGCCQFKGL